MKLLAGFMLTYINNNFVKLKEDSTKIMTPGTFLIIMIN